MRSIRFRVLGTVLLSQVLLVAGIVALLLHHERTTRMRALDAQLQGRADSLAGAIQDSEDAGANVFVDPREFHPEKGDLYAVYSDTGHLVGSVNASAALFLPATGSQGITSKRIERTSYRVREQRGLRIIDRAETNGSGVQRPITIIYATPETGVRHELAETTRFYLLAGLLSTLIVTLLVTWSLNQSLRPISALADAAAEIQAPPAMTFKPPASVLEVQELYVLARSLDGMVTRVQGAFAREHQFVSDAAHELKTGVAVLRSSIQVLLVRARSEEEYVAGLHRALEDAERVEAIVRQMLQLAEVTESAAGIESSDLSVVAGKVTRSLSSMSEEREVPVLLKGQAGTYVPLSQYRSALLIENLLSNAIQHSFKGEQVQVEIASGKGTVELSVKDLGEGIHPDAVDHVFERFYREDASRARNTGGTGLGLSICKAIVEKAGGQIRLDSVLGKGTRVQVTFRSA